MSVLWWCRTQISGEQKTLKRYCKSTRIMNVNWLFRAVGMHYVQKKKKLNKGKLGPTSEFWIFFTFQQGLAPSWQHVGCQFLCQPLGRGSKVMLVFFEEKLKVPITCFSLICKFLDQIHSNLSYLDQQSENDWTSRFFKNKYICLIMTGNDRLEKVTSFRSIGQNFKSCHRSKFLEK